jgi:hypothetical protein
LKDRFGRAGFSPLFFRHKRAGFQPPNGWSARSTSGTAFSSTKKSAHIYCTLPEKIILTSPVQVRSPPCNLRIAASVRTGWEENTDVISAVKMGGMQKAANPGERTSGKCAI